MPEEQVQQEAQQTNQPDISTQLQQSMWEGESQQSQSAEQTTNAGTAAATPAEVKVEEEILDPKDWLKREFDTDDISVIKQEREELKKLRESAKTPAEVKYANDQSKLFHEAILAGKEEDVYKFLHEKRRLEKLTNPEVSKISAEEVIKYSIAKKNQNLSSDEVDFLYSKKFSIPSKPTQTEDEADQDYETRVKVWEGNVQAIEKEMIIEAKMAMPELEKLKTELVLPTIEKQEAANEQPQLSEEDQKKAQLFKESFLKSADDSIKNFNGFSHTVEDKDVKIPVNYGLSTEEKTFITDKIKAFAESNYNANALFAQDWVNNDGTINATKMTEDLSKIYFGDKVFQKFASDGAAQRLELYLKEKKNINVNETRQVGDFTPNDKTNDQKLAEAYWNTN
jgi:hypothetical protein